MSRLIVILAITTAASASTSAYLWKQTQQERSRADELQARVAQLEHPRARPEPPRSFPPGDDAAPAAQPATSTAPRNMRLGILRAAPAAAEIQMGTDFREAQERFAREQRALMEDPEYREARRVQQRMMLRQNYPDLAEGVGIPADQADRLLDLLAAQQVDPVQEFFPVGDKNDPEAVARWQRKMEEKQRTDRAAVAELLGPDGQQRWTDYQNSLGARFRVRQLNTELEASGAPLRQDQLKPLQQALATADEQMRKAWLADAERLQALGQSPAAAEQLKVQEETLKRMSEHNELMRNSVSQILSREQLDAYKEIQDRELQMMEAQLRIQRAQMQAQERSGVPMDAGNAFYSADSSANIAIQD